MSKIDTGGYVNLHVKAGFRHPGITRRDWLIGNILKGLVSNPNLMDNDRMNGIATGVVSGKFFVDCAEHLADKTIAEGRKGDE